MDIDHCMPVFDMAYSDDNHLPYYIQRSTHHVVRDVDYTGFICYPLQVDLNDNVEVGADIYHMKIKTMRFNVDIYNNDAATNFPGWVRFIVFCTPPVSSWVNDGCSSLFSPLIGVNSFIDPKLLKRDGHGITVLHDGIYCLCHQEHFTRSFEFNFRGPSNYTLTNDVCWSPATNVDSIYVACVASWCGDSAFMLQSDSVSWVHRRFWQRPVLEFGQCLDDLPDHDNDCG
uniref:26 kDa protein n=1 Tax=Beet necrotic yellow vein virus TaxID=31721 RepID=A0A0G2YJS9_9VIRU|nr:26 kDa protein [Beet necrotic yellow vein virus]